MIKQTGLIITLMLAATSCGVVKKGTIPWDKKPETKPVVADKGGERPAAAGITVADSELLSKSEKKTKESLEIAYKDWQGVPYVLGGTGYDGVDCSSFMQIVFEDYFGLKLPRNTKDQIKVGKSVKQKGIKLGDLVFFKTGKNTLHVGVMVNGQEFMHASTSSGVMISGLQERYWAERYLTARRVL